MLFPKPIEKDDLAALMRHNVTYCLEHDYDVIWDSIFYANERNREYLAKFFKEVHPDDNYIFNFDVSFEETVRRHNTRAKSNDFGEQAMKEWYQPIESLGYSFEYLIPENNTLDQSVSQVRNIAQI